MSGLDIFAWIIFLVIILSVIVVLISIAVIPGKVAQKRNHPQAEAINVAGWLGLLLTMGIVWVFAMVWALTVTASTEDATELAELDRLRARIADLEGQLTADRSA